MGQSNSSLGYSAVPLSPPLWGRFKIATQRQQAFRDAQHHQSHTVHNISNLVRLQYKTPPSPLSLSWSSLSRPSTFVRFTHQLCIEYLQLVKMTRRERFHRSDAFEIARLLKPPGSAYITYVESPSPSWAVDFAYKQPSSRSLSGRKNSLFGMQTHRQPSMQTANRPTTFKNILEHLRKLQNIVESYNWLET